MMRTPVLYKFTDGVPRTPMTAALHFDGLDLRHKEGVTHYAYQNRHGRWQVSIVLGVIGEFYPNPSQIEEELNDDGNVGAR